MLDEFIQAIREKKFVEVTYIAKKDGQQRRRKCVPFDYGIGKNSDEKKYHLYDLDSPNGRHNLPLLESQILSLVKSNVYFVPSEYITWDTNWHIERDWGIHS